METKRIEWIDVARFFGIFFIYLGHFGTAVGASYNFVFTFHVPLFFLISGCVENFNKEQKFGKYILKKIKNILIPFFTFSIISIIIHFFYKSASIGDIKVWLMYLLKGNIRNTFFAGSLWFLTCLFIVEILFYIIKKINNKQIILIICFIIYMFYKNILPQTPYLLYNLDSALYYIIFYAIGYITYPYILELFKLDTLQKKILYTITGTISFLYTALLFFQKEPFRMFYSIQYIKDIILIIRPLITIYLIFILSKMFEKNELMNKLGKNTLYLCGCEYIVKTLVICFVSIFGMNITITTPLSGYIYTFFLLIIANKYVNPILRQIIFRIQERYSEIVSNLLL